MKKRHTSFIIFTLLGLQLIFAERLISQNAPSVPQKKAILKSEIKAEFEQVGNMVKIPAGVFWMGNNTGEGFTNETPVHAVYLDSFYIDIYEVMNIDYAEFLNAGGNNEHYHPIMSDDKICGIFRYPDGRYAVTPGREDYPVTYVTWDDAAAYAQWRGKRLPTEAEWEKAARGGLRSKKTAYGDVTRQDEANYSGRNVGSQWVLDRWEYTSPVGSLRPNNYGLFDMCGNLWEWVQDSYDPAFYKADTMYNPVNDPRGIHNWRNKIIRGGCYADENGQDSYLRVAARGPNYPIPDNWLNRIGFRCASSVPPSEEQQRLAGFEYVAQKMKENNPELYGNLSLDSLKSLILLRRTQNPVSSLKSNIKSLGTGAALSLILPGVGEFYSGRWTAGLIFIGLEIAGWTSAISDNSKAGKIETEFRPFAESHFDYEKYDAWMFEYKSLHNGQNPPFYMNLSLPIYIQYQSKSVYNSSTRRYDTVQIPVSVTIQSEYYSLIARSDQFLPGWDDYDPFTGSYGKSANRDEYNSVRDFRANQKKTYEKRAKIAVMAVAGNHLISVFDTIFGIKRNSIYRSRGWSWETSNYLFNGNSMHFLSVRYKW